MDNAKSDIVRELPNRVATAHSECEKEINDKNNRISKKKIRQLQEQVMSMARGPGRTVAECTGKAVVTGEDHEGVEWGAVRSHCSSLGGKRRVCSANGRVSCHER